MPFPRIRSFFASLFRDFFYKLEAPLKSGALSIKNEGMGVEFLTKRGDMARYQISSDMISFDTRNPSGVSDRRSFLIW